MQVQAERSYSEPTVTGDIVSQYNIPGLKAVQSGGSTHLMCPLVVQVTRRYRQEGGTTKANGSKRQAGSRYPKRSESSDGGDSRDKVLESKK